jgi:hypothetical protein
MFINKNKSNFLPKKGSFRKIQENFVNRQVLNEDEASPEQQAIATKYNILGKSAIPAIDLDFIKKHKLEKTWSRKSVHPRAKKLATTFSKEIKNLGGVEGNPDNLKNAMKKHVSKGDGWLKGNPFDDVIRYQGVEVYWNGSSDNISIKDFAARKRFDVSFKDGNIKSSNLPNPSRGGPHSGFFPAANEKHAKAGDYTGYWQGF